MKITIIGAGAMGCLFGGLLTEHGQEEVQLLDVNKEQVEALNKNGLVFFQNGIERVIKIRATVDPAAISCTDLALIFVKHGQTRQAAQTAAHLLQGKGSVLTLQNGMGNAEIIMEVLEEKRVICGTTAQGAMLLEPGKIQHSGTGDTVIGMWGQQLLPSVEQVATLFSAAGIPTKGGDDIEATLWNKLFANVGINAITALTNIRNGQLLELEVTKKLIQEAVEEAITVARSLSVPISPDVLENVFAIAQATASNRSSMGQDVDGQRFTEIDAINGYIVRKAEEQGIKVPVNRTLTGLIKTLQGHYSVH
ncbi:MAG: 2-dehydropantoate 2-reductase [Candidatus Electrothrix sp. AR3]|nr:2-dehydropantoate 2-reductase [Candidatus Electrothrix sp. AR3]